MEFLSSLALVLLTLVGYSSGSVMAAKGRAAVPGIADLMIVVVLWIAALATRSALGKWSSIVIWLVIGLCVGAILARVRADSYPKSEPSDTGKGLWNAWKGFSRRMGNYQSRVLMAFIYFTVVLPFGLGTMLFGDPLKINGSSGSSNWKPKELPLTLSVEEARRQF
jgi:hypothetical protein